MKKILFIVWVGVFFAFSGVLAITADEESQEQAADEAVDKEAESPEGKRAVVDKIKNQYNVDQTRIDDLRQKNLGYGEIKHVFSLADQMPGGINDENVNKIMDLRKEQKMGWGRVAQELDLKLGHGKGSEKPDSVKSETKKGEKFKAERSRYERSNRSSRPEKPGRQGKK